MLTQRERNNYITSTILPNAVRLYKGTNQELFYSTLVWNSRYLASAATMTVSDLDLLLYSATGNALIGTSTSRAKDNVEQVSSTYPGSVVLAVVNVNSSLSSPEPFAVAMSTGGFTEALGPQLTTSCVNPTSVTPATSFTVDCTVLNQGDLTAFNVSGSLNYTNASGGAIIDFGTLPAGNSATRRWSVAAPASSGTYGLVAAVTSSSYGAVFNGSANTAFTSSATPLCSYVLSTNLINVPATGGQGAITVSAPVGCTWVANSNSEWITITGGGTGSGSGSVTYSVASSGGVQRSGSLNIAGQIVTVVQSSASQSIGLRFVSLSPCRVMETRPEYNFPVRTGNFGPPFMNAGETRTLYFPQSTACFIPSAAKAYVVNVTLIPRGSVDFATVYPAGESRPTYRTVSSPDGQIVANSAIVKAGVIGGISVYTSGAADVLIDIAGYFTDDTNVSNLVFYPMPPCRVVETRAIYQDPLIMGTVFGRGQMNDRETRTYPIRSSQKCGQGIPSTVAAYAVTMTVVPPGPLAYVTSWPTGQGQPGVSSINSFLGRTLANSVILPAGMGGSIDVFAFNKTDLLMDITGYFAPDNGAGLFYYPVTQCRAADSTLYGDQTARTIAVPSSPTCGGIPANAKGYALNVTALPGGNPMPFITAYPTGQPRPGASILNAFEGQTVTNSAIIPAGTNGAVDIFAFTRTNVIVELSGYFGR